MVHFIYHDFNTLLIIEMLETAKLSVVKSPGTNQLFSKICPKNQMGKENINNKDGTHYKTSK